VTRKREQHPVRVYSDTWEKLRVKTKADGINFQKLTEVLITAYLKNNKEIKRIVANYVEKKGTRKNRTGLDEMEADHLLRLIEEKHSPLRFMEKVSEEIEYEEQNIYDHRGLYPRQEVARISGSAC
jgi:hypothetical protein